MVKNSKKKKKVSKDSLGTGSSSGNPKTKKKKSKKKTSKEELLDPLADHSSNRSELNLLAALENPIASTGNVSDDSTTQQEEVEKPNKVSKISIHSRSTFGAKIRKKCNLEKPERG